jgi:hypothetical protein
VQKTIVANIVENRVTKYFKLLIAHSKLQRISSGAVSESFDQQHWVPETIAKYSVLEIIKDMKCLRD